MSDEDREDDDSWMDEELVAGPRLILEELIRMGTGSGKVVFEMSEENVKALTVAIAVGAMSEFPPEARQWIERAVLMTQSAMKKLQDHYLEHGLQERPEITMRFWTIDPRMN